MELTQCNMRIETRDMGASFLDEISCVDVKASVVLDDGSTISAKESVTIPWSEPSLMHIQVAIAKVVNRLSEWNGAIGEPIPGIRLDPPVEW